MLRAQKKGKGRRVTYHTTPYPVMSQISHPRSVPDGNRGDSSQITWEGIGTLSGSQSCDISIDWYG